MADKRPPSDKRKPKASGQGGKATTKAKSPAKSISAVSPPPPAKSPSAAGATRTAKPKVPPAGPKAASRAAAPPAKPKSALRSVAPPAAKPSPAAKPASPAKPAAPAKPALRAVTPPPPPPPAAAPSPADLLEERRALARDLVRLRFPNITNPDVDISDDVDEGGERIVLAAALNGPGAAMVSAKSTHWRWVAITADDLTGIVTLRDFGIRCFVHLAPAPDPATAATDSVFEGDQP